MVGVALGYLIAGCNALELLKHFGFMQISTNNGVLLASLSSLCFVVTGLLLASCTPTASLGRMLMDRVLNTRANWETDALRSFCEVGVWLGVIWSTFLASSGGVDGFVFALVCGTVAGCAIAVTGEALQGPMRALEKDLRDCLTKREQGAASSACKRNKDSTDVSLKSSLMLLLSFYGYGTMSILYENCTDILAACCLIGAAGLVLWLVSNLIESFGPTRRAGITLQERILHTSENWHRYPMRSAIESTFWFGVVIGTYELHGNVQLALQAGTLSGIIICLGGEYFSNWQRAKDGEECELVPSCFVAHGGFWLLFGIFARTRHWLSAAALSAAAGIGYLCLCQLLFSWGPTQRVGKILHSRWEDAAQNWRDYPLRSLFETSMWLLATWTGYAQTRSVIAAIGMSFFGAAPVFLTTAVGWGTDNENLGKKHSSLTAREQDPAKQVATTYNGEPQKCTFTWAEVAAHSRRDDAWLVVDGQVLDVTKWAPFHPGGSIIYKFAGADATDQFAAFHRPSERGRLRKFIVGQVETSQQAPSPATLEYRALRHKLWQEGYFEVDAWYFVVKSMVLTTFMGCSIAMVLLLPHKWLLFRTVVAGILLGMFWQQAAFIAHDSAHNGVIHRHQSDGFNWLAWIFASPLFGISAALWTEEHSMHHAITMRPREDPQFNYLPLCLISMKEIGLPNATLDNVARLLVPLQHITFLPLAVLIGRFNFYLIAVSFAVKRLFSAANTRQFFQAFMDVAGMCMYWTWYISLVCALDDVYERVIFVLASHWSVGILHLQLLMSHLATSSFTVEEERAEQFFSFQLKTTRNIDATWYDHWFHGGLEFQIEHHLFPQLPRHCLERVQPFVKDICKRHNIPYRSSSFSSVLLEVLQDLHRLAEAIAKVPVG